MTQIVIVIIIAVAIIVIVIVVIVIIIVLVIVVVLVVAAANHSCLESLFYFPYITICIRFLYKQVKARVNVR
jgi:hypothetical protein